jgi:hypothetical protein
VVVGPVNVPEPLDEPDGAVDALAEPEEPLEVDEPLEELEDDPHPAITIPVASSARAPVRERRLIELMSTAASPSIR